MPSVADDLLALLDASPLVLSIRVVHYDETPAGKLELKIRCRLARGYQLQIWLHREQEFGDYAYQLFSGQPLLRWDNAPHYPHIGTAPHHYHSHLGEVTASPLRGDPPRDLLKVLAEIESWLVSHG